jgi:RES domain-containing protein
VTGRVLAKALNAYRIGDAQGEYPVFSGEGSKENPGRWNERGQGLIYASEHYSTAMLEKLVRLGEMPPQQHFVEITIERGVSYEEVNDALIPGWYQHNMAKARAFGAKWFFEKRSAILIAPSVVARLDMNVLINPQHSDFAHISVGRERPIWWDERLFAA